MYECVIYNVCFIMYSLNVCPCSLKFIIFLVMYYDQQIADRDRQVDETIRRIEENYARKME